jgi:phage tail-like protein
MAENEIKVLLRVNGPELDDMQVTVGRQGLRVGRTRDNSLPLENREISRQHLRIIWRDDKYFVEDLNSSNGTWLNDVRLTPREAREIRPDDVIRAGPFLLRVLRFVVAEVVELLPEIEPQLGANGIVQRVRVDVSADMYGIMTKTSTWLQYLPEIYSDDEFVGRYLLVFESIFSPIVWMLDNFDFYLDADTMPAEWLQWVGSWFDLLVLPELSIEKQRAIIKQLGWLFSRRGTKSALQRLIELYFDTSPEIIEPADEPCHFVVKLKLMNPPFKNSREIVERLIASQKPAFASYSLELEGA